MKQGALNVADSLRPRFHQIPTDLFRERREMAVSTVWPRPWSHDADAVFTKLSTQRKQAEPCRSKYRRVSDSYFELLQSGQKIANNCVKWRCGLVPSRDFTKISGRPYGHHRRLSRKKEVGLLYDWPARSEISRNPQVRARLNS